MSTILIIDDDAAVRQLLADILTDKGHYTVVAAHGVDALAYLNVITVECIISDLMIPILGGAAFITAVRAQPRYTNVPIILTSAGLTNLMLPPGAFTGFLKKPFPIRALLALVHHALTTTPTPPSSHEQHPTGDASVLSA